ncbi:IucA/IucC family protein [Streptomyces sp. NBC_01190]|uniref:IucA/IucC family protein n=1 Tax=Streptomyces sp. NBC_01190 TaxID=2903767 RepID=UPI0038709678|nr:IucA/IucC family siderophore biosynthesis protein [Streptomyces sp. NBC_01190]
MTETGPAAGTAAEELLLRLLSALLREDAVGLRSRGTVEERADGRWLRVPGASDGTALLLPVRADGFQSEYAARLPLLRTAPHGRRLTGAAEILAALGELAAAEDRAGFAALTREYQDALATLRLQAATAAEVTTVLEARHGGELADWRGLSGALAFDTLAARAGHPLYPTGAARPGVPLDRLPRYAPEFAPRFALRWLALPRDAVTVRGTGGERLDARWPTLADLGLPALDGSHLALPVHPLTADEALRQALRATGPAARAVLADRQRVEVAPTLSMRTVALVRSPHVHLKLPLATSSLGLLNRRTVKPGTLTDGAAAQRLLETVTAREPRFRGRILHADETRYAHAGHELLAVLVRRYPHGLEDCAVLPLAALLGRAPDGRLVIDHLADRWFSGDPVALLDAVLTPLLDWQTTLFGYGIALESHQQNISLLLDEHAGRTRVRLLLKDDDGPRINRVRLLDRLGADAPEPGEFDDPRTFVDNDRPVLDLFTTITVHLCAGAFAFALARHGRAPLDRSLDLVRDRLDASFRRLGDRPGQPGAVLRAAVLDAPRLPVKAMVTAGTLLTKTRSGASDINKHYTTGPNYLPRRHG